MDINELLQSQEGKTLEFKRDLSSPAGVIRTVIAFANTAGGVIILGVEDQTKYICGIQDPRAEEERLANFISDCISPQILPEIEVIPWRNTYLLAIQVFPSSAKPHYLRKEGVDKGTFIRVGSTNRLADKVMLSELQRVRFEDSFDRQPISELSSEALDLQVASELFAPIKTLNKADLESMDLVMSYQHKKVATVAGLILFGKERSKYFPDAYIQVGRFNGITKTHIADTKIITAYPILAINEVMEFVQKHAMQSIEIKGVRNTQIWSLPFIAIREAMINAVVHTDYAQRGAPIRLAIFDDRIEIENPGLLLFGLTIDEIKKGVSKLRNRVIGQIFYQLRLIERWGSGIKRIIDSCIEAGFSEPLFEEIGTHFRVTLFTKMVEKTILSELDQMIATALRNSKTGLSTKEISMVIQKSQRATRTRLINLIQKGMISELAKGINDPGRKYFWVEKYEPSIVAFLDISEVNNHMILTDYDVKNTLSQLVEGFSKQNGDGFHQKDNMGSQQIRPFVTSFLDNIVISRPTLLQNSEDFYVQLHTILNAIVYFTYEALSKGCFLRGALSCDKIYHKHSILMGVALAEAAEYKKIANYPRVILTPSFIREFDMFSQKQSFGWNHRRALENFYFKKDDDDVMYFDWLNYFTDSLENGQSQERKICLMQVVQKARQEIVLSLSESVPNMSEDDNGAIFKELDWAKKYFDRFLSER